jgi:hypothetical protein
VDDAVACLYLACHLLQTAVSKEEAFQVVGPTLKDRAMELILSICLIASPGVCREEAVSLSVEQVSLPTQCMMGAQPVIAEWSESHPKWKVTKWRCGRPTAGRDI